MPELIDSHAHLTFPDFALDLEGVLARARSAGVSRVVCIGSGSGREGRKATAELARRFPDFLHPAYGLHPHEAQSSGAEEIDELCRLAGDPQTVAVGEIGLDSVRQLSPLAEQKKLLPPLLDIARRSGKPVIFHLRGAEAEFFSLLRENPWLEESGFVVHCFTGSAEMARAILAAGGYLGVSGVITFPKARDLAELFRREVPPERMLLETDCPYLAPVPHRGACNEPAYLADTAAALAALKGLTGDDVGRITSHNARRLFRLPAAGGPTIAYRIRDSLYLNLTNRCFLSCIFCGKRRDFAVKGHELRLAREPEAAEVIAAVDVQPAGFRELVFCGYGEPMVRRQVVLEVARWARRARPDLRLRLNTDGTVEVMTGQQILEAFCGLLDVVSVSLNAADAATYARICPSAKGEEAYRGVLAFIRRAKALFPEVVATAVALPGLDTAAIERLCRSELGVPFRLRPYNELG